MIHNRAGRKLKRTASHRKALLCNMASSLFQHKKISTTEAKAKELRGFAEQLITRAKHALQREQQGLLPQGQTIDIHNRREVYRSIRDKGVVQELFDTIAPAVLNRPGGYTRIVKLGTRRGDAGRIAMIELVDFSASRDGVIRLRRKKAAPKSVATANKPVAAQVPAAPVVEEVAPMVAEVAPMIEEVAPVVAEVVAPMAEAPIEVAEIAPVIEEVAPVEVVAEADPIADEAPAETTTEEPSEPSESDEPKADSVG